MTPVQPELLDKVLAISFSLAILAQAAFARRLAGTWLFPASLFGLFWFGYTFLPLVVLFSVPANPWAVGFIFLNTVAFTLSSIFLPWHKAYLRNQDKRKKSSGQYDNRLMRATFFISATLSLVFLVTNTIKQDITLFDLIFNFFESSAKYTEMRYAEEITVNIFLQLGIVLTYVASALGGFVYYYAKSLTARAPILLLTFLPSIFVMTTQSAKGQLFLAVILFFGAILVCRLNDGRTHVIGRKGLRNIFWGVLAIIPMLIVSFMSRGLYDSGDSEFIVQRLIFYFASYAFGHMYAFSDWFNSLMGRPAFNTFFVEEHLQYGFYTVMGLFKLAGSTKEVPQGVFDEYFLHGDLLSSNVYTMFRGLILDFGLVGALIFMFVTGAILHLSFYRLLTRHHPIMPACTFIFMMGYFYTSFIISVFIWNSYYVSIVILWMILAVNQRCTLTYQGLRRKDQRQDLGAPAEGLPGLWPLGHSAR